MDGTIKLVKRLSGTYATLAQLVEQVPCKHQVVGSMPTCGPESVGGYRAGVSKTLAEGSIPSRLAILGSSNGRTLGFEPGNIGSSPVPRTFA